MASTYRIELDLAAAAWRMKDKIRQLSVACGLDTGSPDRMALGITGPFRLDGGMTEEELLDRIERSAGDRTHLSFLVDGWERAEQADGYLLSFSVRLSGACREWAADLASALPLIDGGAVGNGGAALPAVPPLPPRAMRRVWRRLGEDAGWIERLRVFLETRSDPRRDWYVRPETLPVDTPRIVVTKDGIRWREFDLPSRRWLSPEDADRSDVREETLRRLRVATGSEVTEPSYAEEREIFVIGDLHLGHAGIIRYCARPFPEWDGDEMDRVLIASWNRTVRPQDRVFYLGDLSYNETGAPLRGYREQLNGRIAFIRGNHDAGLRGAVDQEILQYRGEQILLIHNPKKAPEGFDGWIIHGHTHNSDLRRSPFVDLRRRRINVSAEVIGYRPVSLRAIFAAIEELQESEDGLTRRLLMTGEF